MAYPNYRFPLQSKPLSSLVFTNIFLLLCLHLSYINALFFNFSSFDTNQADIILDWEASFYGSSVFLTKNPLNGSIKHSVGRARYQKAVQLYRVNGSTTTLTDFTTQFTFNISNVSSIDDGNGHGLAFVLIPENADWRPNNTEGGGGLLGLFETVESALSNTTTNPLVAIEFDTLKNDQWDPSRSHIGIDVNSIESKRYKNVTGGFMNRGTANALVTYNSTTNNLSASLRFAGSLDSYIVHYIIDLSAFLPERIRVGFTASTGTYVETHELYSWSFNSSMEENVVPSLPVPSPPLGHKNAGLGFVVMACLVVVAVVVVVLTSGATLYWLWSRKKSRAQSPLFEDLGPKEFSYNELVEATNDFDPEYKLGKGGFGDVYKGILPSSNEEVAVKKFRSGISGQGETEFSSEVNAISRLRHKNLVQLKGWCNENKELLLVYEFMPNRSLDFHLFSENREIPSWPTRYNIVLGLASSVNYLQNESNISVIHRDIKSSNIMLDQHFNAKLGDFGLARFTDHGQSLNSTNLAGTRGYQAPELVIRWENPTKASDIYSFGVVALEIGTGKRAILRENRGSLVDWVWDKHTRDTIVDEAVDERVKNSVDFNGDEARRLMMIGLACCHPNARLRPSIEQVKDMLKLGLMHQMCHA